MIKAIKFIGTDFNFEPNKTSKLLTTFDKFNLFVGTNNSGKSRFLRFFFSRENILIITDNRINEIFEEDFKRQLISSLSTIKYNSSSYGFEYKHHTKVNEFLNLIDTKSQVFFDSFGCFIEGLLSIKEEDFIESRVYPKHSLTRVISQYKGIANNIINKINSLQVGRDGFEYLYIPVIRGLRPIQVEGANFTNEDSYLKRTKKDYFAGMKTLNQNIYTGLSIYKDVMKLLLGTEQQRESISDFQVFLSDNIFFKKVILIPKYEEDVLHIKIGNEAQREIFNLGDGLQSLITILFPIFIRRNKKSLVFVEEPELHLHSGWQKLLLKALNKFENHQFFFSTHSNSFLNSKRVKIFNVSRVKNKSIITYTNLESSKVKILDDLGYRPSDLFQTNYILWVEGPSDKFYLKKFLYELFPELRINKDYEIMFYGGSNYNHFLKTAGLFDLTTIKTINRSFGIIFDSDRESKSQKYNKQKLEIKCIFEDDDSFCWLTKYREIENYIPISVLSEAIMKVHNKTDIDVPSGFFDDRCKVIDRNMNISYKSRIKLEDDLFRKIQMNGDGTLRGISFREVKKSIENSINNTASKTFSINKTKVAEYIYQMSFEDFIWEKELKKEIHKLGLKIKNANGK